jgi:hypothetical protein
MWHAGKGTIRSMIRARRVLADLRRCAICTTTCQSHNHHVGLARRKRAPQTARGEKNDCQPGGMHVHDEVYTTSTCSQNHRNCLCPLLLLLFLLGMWSLSSASVMLEPGPTGRSNRLACSLACRPPTTRSGTVVPGSSRKLLEVGGFRPPVWVDHGSGVLLLPLENRCRPDVSAYNGSGTESCRLVCRGLDDRCLGGLVVGTALVLS